MPESVESSGGSRRGGTDPLCDEGADELDDAARETRQHADPPGFFRALRSLEDRRHHEDDECDDRRRVDSVGQGGDVGAAGPRRQPMRLPCVEQVADEHRNGRSRQDAFVKEFLGFAGHPAQPLTERDDEEKLHEVVDEESEEPVEVAGDEQTHGGFLDASTGR